MTHTVTWIQTDGPKAGQVQRAEFDQEIKARQHREQMELYVNTYLVDEEGCIEGMPAEEWYAEIFQN
ncbi:hypothetical protein [Streptomyces sp. NPDC005385]|uniref:hypothetical protein n=1 Tax=Streptomyces sp. NPDC005385 TaxID=3157039 RepID=UPI0033AF1A8C